MPDTYARVIAISDHETGRYLGHIGRVVHVTEADPKYGLEALLILEFANGVRDVFRAPQLAPAQQGDTPSPDAGPLSVVVKSEPTPRATPRKPRQPAAPPGYCVHGHPRASPSETCRECDRKRKGATRAAMKGKSVLTKPRTTQERREG